MSFYKYLKSKGFIGSIDDLAKFAGVTPRTLRNYYKDNKLIIDSYIDEWRKKNEYR